MLALLISLVAYFIAAFFINRWLIDQGLDGGWSKRFIIFVLASVVSWGVGEGVSAAEHAFEPHHASTPLIPKNVAKQLPPGAQPLLKMLQ
ncbi:MAG: hypothetical protein KGJ12_01045 [Gammaproteobacteria bacterium]|nr:hypothetical protein [Gammaproteobacteria bacterium]